MQLVNNLFVGAGIPAKGKSELVSNLQTDASGFVGRAAYDYRLSANSPAIDVGMDPGARNGFSLVPTAEYVHPLKQRDRTITGPIDLGAFEFTSP